MLSTTVKRSGVAYALAGAVTCVLLLLVFGGSYNPASQLDPHPMGTSTWQSLFGERAVSRHYSIPGKGGKCKRTMRIVLDASFGLGSSLSLLVIPGLAMARHYGYTPIIDDSEFNYGRLTDFLEPMQLDCDPGDDWDTIDRVQYHSEGWEQADHVILARGFLWVGGPVQEGVTVLVDNFWRSEMMTLGQSEGVAAIDAKALQNAYETMPYLPSEMSFTQAVRPAFRASYLALNQLFTLNRVMRDEVEKLVQATRPARSEGIPVMGAIVRLGDKSFETHDNPGANAYANWQGYAATLREQSALLLAGRKDVKPILMVMSDDTPTALNGLRSVLGDAEFDIRPMDTPVPTMPFAESDDRYVPPAIIPTTERRRGHSQGQFNHQPVLARIASGRTLVRDLYYMAKHTDSLVVSSGSNVGRFAILLAGEEKAYGSIRPDDQNVFSSIGGLSRSIDTRWFPCVYYAGCFRA